MMEDLTLKKSRFRHIDLLPDRWGKKTYGTAVDTASVRAESSQMNFTVNAHFFLIMLSPQAKRQTSFASSRSNVFDATPGTTEFIPSDCDFSAVWPVPKESVTLVVEPENFVDFIASEFDRSPGNLDIFSAAEVDPVAHQIASLIRDELDNDHPNALFVESLSVAVVSHLLQRALGLRNSANSARVKGGLAPHIRDRIDEYLRQNLHRAIALGELAHIAGLSYGHFLRAFRQSVGEPPHRYLMRLRAQKAHEMIVQTDLSYGDISKVCGFANQSHMTSVMKKFFSSTPKAIRNSL